MATRISMPNAIKVGMRIIAAPSPAMVSMVVNTNVIKPAIAAAIMSHNNANTLPLDNQKTEERVFRSVIRGTRMSVFHNMLLSYLFCLLER